MKTPALLQPRVATKAELSQDITLPSEPLMDLLPFGGVRRPVDDVWMGELSPTRVLAVLKSAQAGTDRGDLSRLADVIIRRNPNLRANLSTRILALAGYDLVAEAPSDSAQDTAIAAAVNELLAGDVMTGMIPEMAYGGIWANYSLHDLQWDWQPLGVEFTGATFKPGHWVIFDPKDGVTPLLKPREMGGEYEPLLEGGKYAFHVHGMLPGMTVTGGLAYTAAFYYAIQNIVLKDWLGFVEMFGQPFRIGTYDKASAGPSDTAKAQRTALRKALENLGADAWAMLPEGMKIEIIEGAQNRGASETYERSARYLDECLARLLLGGNLTSGTGNTGSGGSQALGNVHNDVRADLTWADGKAIAKTIRAKVVTPFVRWNFGDSATIPKVHFLIEEPADLAALATALAQLVPLGLEVAQEEVRAMYGLRAPKAGEATLRAPTAPSPTLPTGPENPGDSTNDSEDAAIDTNDATAPPAKSTKQDQKTAKHLAAAHALDELDALIAEYERDYAYVNTAVNARIAAVVAALPATATLQDMRDALGEFTANAPLQDLQNMFARALTCASAAGVFGSDIGGAHIRDQLPKKT